MYDHLSNGWLSVLWYVRDRQYQSSRRTARADVLRFCFAVVASGIPVGMIWAGNQALWKILLGRGKKNNSVDDEDDENRSA